MIFRGFQTKARGAVHAYDWRTAENYCLINIKPNVRNHSTKYSGAAIWSMIFMSTRLVKSLEMFKNIYKWYILDTDIELCNSNDVTRSAVGLSQAASRWKQMRTHAPKRSECLLVKIIWAQISSRDARFIISLHAGAVVWPLLHDRHTFRWCFDLGFHDEMAASKSIIRQKGLTYADTRLPKYMMGLVYLSANHALNTWYSVSEFHDITVHITECVSNVKWA